MLLTAATFHSVIDPPYVVAAVEGLEIQLLTAVSMFVSVSGVIVQVATLKYVWNTMRCAIAATAAQRRPGLFGGERVVLLFRSHRGPTSTTSTAMQPHRSDQPHARSSDGKHRCSATARECVCCSVSVLWDLQPRASGKRASRP